MTRRPRRNHAPAFKVKVALAAIKGDRTLAEALQSSSTSTPIRSHRGKRSSRRPRIFGPVGGNRAVQPAIDVKSLHAKIGESTLENDFLEGALNKAGLLSAKR